MAKVPPVDEKVFLALCEKYNSRNLRENAAVKISQEIDAKGGSITDRAIRDFFKKTPESARMLSDNLNDLCEILLGVEYETAIAQLNNHFVLDKYIDEYKSYLERTCGSFRILRMNRPADLSALYVEADVLSAPKNNTAREIFARGLDAFKRADLESHHFSTSSAIEEVEKLIVLGGPGSGKSTLLRYTTIHYLNQYLVNKSNNRVLPFYSELRELVRKYRKSTIMEGIKLELNTNIRHGEKQTEKMLCSGSLIILLDGLDEVGTDDFEWVCNGINDFVDKYYKNKFVITCRKNSLSNYKFERFTEVEISGFDSAKVTSLVEKWFAKDVGAYQVRCDSERDEENRLKECKNKFLQELDKNESVKDLASSPLLLTYLLCTFEYNNGIIASRRLTLCHEIIEILIKEWDRTRLVRRDIGFQDVLERPVLFNLLGKLAHSGFEHQELKTDWTSFEVEGLIQSFIKKLGITVKDQKSNQVREPDAALILKSLEANYGILIESSQGIYSFPHLIFQEYFAANYIVENQNQGLIGKLLNEHLLDHHWQEIFCLVADRLVNPDFFLIELYKRASELSKQEHLQKLLRWLNQTVNFLFDRYSSSWAARILAFDLDTNLYMSRLGREGKVERLYFHELFLNLKEFNADRGKLTLNSARNDTALWLTIIHDHAQDKVAEKSQLDTKNTRLPLQEVPRLIRDLLLIQEEKTVAEDFEECLEDAREDNNDIAIPGLLKDLEGLQKTLPSDKDSLEAWEKWVNDLQQLMLDKFKIGYQIEFTEDQYKSLEDYVYINHLLVKCIRESVTSSKIQREELIDNLLVPAERIPDNLR